MNSSNIYTKYVSWGLTILLYISFVQMWHYAITDNSLSFIVWIMGYLILVPLAILFALFDSFAFKDWRVKSFRVFANLLPIYTPIFYYVYVNGFSSITEIQVGWKFFIPIISFAFIILINYLAYKYLPSCIKHIKKRMARRKSKN